MGAKCGKSGSAAAPGELAIAQVPSCAVGARNSMGSQISVSSCRHRHSVRHIASQEIACGRANSLFSTESSFDRRGSFVRTNISALHIVYNIEESKLGEGTYGVVRKGTHRLTGVVRAIKTVPNGHPKRVESHRREIAIMKGLTHPHIIQLFETFEDSKHIYLAMELCTGGELFDRILAERRFGESQAATIVKQILGAVNYIHDSGLVHRDLKPENFLFQTRQSIEQNSLKLIDFGTATECRPGRFLKTKVGTLIYMAPQVLMGRYDSKSDLWSCGVIMYILLSGHHPFSGKANDDALQTKVRSGIWKFTGETWTHISEDAKELIRSLLKMSTRSRLSAEEALRHEWVQMQAPRATGAELKEAIGERLLQYKVRNGLEKAALEIVAGQLSEEEIRDLRTAFEALDENGDGRITLKELCAGLDKAGLPCPSSEVRKLFKIADTDGSGELNYTQFIAATLDRNRLLTEDVVWTAFNVFDEDGNGRISKQEARNVLNSSGIKLSISTDSLANLDNCDEDEEGGLSFDEFRVIVQGTGSEH